MPGFLEMNTKFQNQLIIKLPVTCLLSAVYNLSDFDQYVTPGLGITKGTCSFHVKNHGYTAPNIPLKKMIPALSWQTPTLSLRVLCGCSVHGTRNLTLHLIFPFPLTPIFSHFFVIFCGFLFYFQIYSSNDFKFPATWHCRHLPPTREACCCPRSVQLFRTVPESFRIFRMRSDLFIYIS